MMPTPTITGFTAIVVTTFLGLGIMMLGLACFTQGFLVGVIMGLPIMWVGQKIIKGGIAIYAIASVEKQLKPKKSTWDYIKYG